MLRQKRRRESNAFFTKPRHWQIHKKKKIRESGIARSQPLRMYHIEE